VARISPAAHQIMASRGINFTGANISQSRTVKDSTINHELTDEFMPDIEDIHRSVALTLEKKDDALHLSFLPSSAHKNNREALAQMFVSAIYTGVQEGKKLGVESIEFNTRNRDLFQISKLFHFEIKSTKDGFAQLSLPKREFEKTLEAADSYLTRYYAAAIVNDTAEIDENLGYFEPKILSLGSLSKPKQFGANQKFYKENGKVFIEEKPDRLNVKVNGVYIGYDDSKKALNPGDMLTIDKKVYIYQQDKKTGENKLSFIASDAYNDYTRLFPKGISKMNLSQGYIGDCYFLASLKSLSNSPKGVELIAKMIEPMPYNNFVVRFPGYPKEAIGVSFADVAATESVDSSTKGAKILEHAFYQLKAKIDWKGVPDVEPSDKAEWLDGGFTQEALHILTGGEMLSHHTTTNSEKQFVNTFMEEAKHNPKLLDETKKLLKELHDKGENVIVGAETSISVNGGDKIIYPDHAYSITNIDPENEKISINNPHDTAQDYVFSYKQFFNHFGAIKAVELKDTDAQAQKSKIN
jgi:hypothetical protein